MRHAEFYVTDHAKVLVRDNPGLHPARREAQVAWLEVSQWASVSQRSLVVELLAPAAEADKGAMGADPVRYDDELRPPPHLAVLEYLHDRDVERPSG